MHSSAKNEDLDRRSLRYAQQCMPIEHERIMNGCTNGFEDSHTHEDLRKCLSSLWRQAKLSSPCLVPALRPRKCVGTAASSVLVPACPAKAVRCQHLGCGLCTLNYSAHDTLTVTSITVSSSVVLSFDWEIRRLPRP
jgi:hypothetical protein